MATAKTTMAAEGADAAKKATAARTGTAAKATTAKKATAARSTAAKKAAAARKTTTRKTTRKSATPKGAGKKNLVIVESPAKARTIEKFLGDDYAVRASNGHLRDLPKSKLGVDVDNNFEPDYLTIRGRAPLINGLKADASTAEHVYLATDPDREGEAISWHLAHLLGLDPSDPCRIEFNEITKSAVTQAIQHPRAIDMQRVNAQQARRVLDRVVGYKLSPLLWHKVRRGLSAGRVQSVAVRIIVDREREIKAFVPEEYWTISALLDSPDGRFEARYYGEGASKARLSNEAEAMAVVDACRSATFRVASVKEGERKRHALPPFTTSQMQQAASSRLGFTSKRTMMIAQQLYEGIESAGGVGLITYMRTDSVRVSSEAQAAAREYIGGKYGPEFVPDKPNAYKSKKNAQDAHEAIRPTSVARTPEQLKSQLTPEQHKLYKLIYSRFLASQMSESRYKTLAYTIDAGGHTFKASGSTLLFRGHLAAYDSEPEEDKQKMLPLLAAGTTLGLVRLDPKQNFTQPPQRYTEASLIKYLEEQGIGRPSTYATIISTIQDRQYVEKEGRSLVPTELGEVVTDLMTSWFSEIVDVTFTAGMEEKLDEVESAGLDWHGILRDFYGPFEQDLETAEKNVEHVKLTERVSDVVCDKCGAQMVYKMGRFGEFLACPNYPECKNTKPIVKEIEARCPKCGAPLVERRTKKKRIFYGCSTYPACDFVSWDKPLDESCPECGSYMVEVRSKGRPATKRCANPDCPTNAGRRMSRSSRAAGAEEAPPFDPDSLPVPPEHPELPDPPEEM